MFIIRKTCRFSFMVFLTCIHIWMHVGKKNFITVLIISSLGLRLLVYRNVTWRYFLALYVYYIFFFFLRRYNFREVLAFLTNSFHLGRFLMQSLQFVIFIFVISVLVRETCRGLHRLHLLINPKLPLLYRACLLNCTF